MKFLIAALLLVLASPVAHAKYDRDTWPHWLDYDGDCVNERHETLIRSSVAKVTMSPDGCYVSKGAWVSPYTGATITRASQIDIDHLVPLAHAYYNGAMNWSTELKAEFANDPLNLIAVDSKSNREKSASGPSVWRPINTAYWCEYAARWNMVKQKYSLTSTANEQSALDEMLNSCPDNSAATPPASNDFGVDEVVSLLSVGQTANDDEFSCGEKRLCGQMTSCEEATFHLNQCGVSKLDGDGNGVPCESICQ